MGELPPPPVPADEACREIYVTLPRDLKAAIVDAALTGEIEAAEAQHAIEYFELRSA